MKLFLALFLVLPLSAHTESYKVRDVQGEYERQGIVEGDVITNVNGQNVQSVNQVMSALSKEDEELNDLSDGMSEMDQQDLDALEAQETE